MFHQINHFSQKSMGIDPAFGSSAFGIVITQRSDNQIQIMHAEEYQRPDLTRCYLQYETSLEDLEK
jgi:hypothetical protein